VKVLIADDDLVPRRLLQHALVEWGYEVVVACDGSEALQLLQMPNAPKLAILDWLMPQMDGTEVCRKIRQAATALPAYIILLTSRNAKKDIVAGLESGANDYVTKPFDRGELQARISVGRKVLGLQQTLTDRVCELEKAMAQVIQLQGLLPICCYCKKIRDDNNYWQQVEGYLATRTDVRFSHGICPECLKTALEDLA
jgi:phosphoserine phosphatase RsbU/P